MTPSQAIAAAKAKGLSVSVSGAKLGMLNLPKHKAKSVSTSSPVRWAIEFSVPCRIRSEQRRSTWAKQWMRQKEQRAILLSTMPCIGILNIGKGRPCIVTWTHIGPKFDSDNLAIAFKALRDGLAEWLGVDDGDELIEWRYQQRSGSPGVEVRIESRAGQ